MAWTSGETFTITWSAAGFFTWGEPELPQIDLFEYADAIEKSFEYSFAPMDRKATRAIFFT